MNLTSPSQARARLDSLGVRPSRALGQNFLIDRNILDILVAAAEPGSTDGVLEVGPGLGVVTEALLQRVGRVTAVEKDRRLAAGLRERLAGVASFRLVEGDMLDLDADGLLADGPLDKVVSNLPYSVGSRILINLAQAARRPALMVVTVQREVAERLAAGPGTKAYGLLGVWIQLDYTVEFVKSVRRTCFWPSPEVGSAIVRLRRRTGPAVPAEERTRFYRLTKLAFSARRKQIESILRRAGGPEPGRILADVGIAPAARPETLDRETWLRLAARWDDRSSGKSVIDTGRVSP